jgi:hypothetical protein
MADLEYFLVAESISVDQTTNRISFFNVVEQIKVQTFPAVVPQLVAVAAWNAEASDDKKDFQATTRVEHPNGHSEDFQHNFRMPGKRSRVVMTFRGMKLESPGKLLLKLSLNGEHQATHSIDVVVPEAEPETS